MRINDHSGELDMHRGTLRAQAIIRDELAAEGFWGGAQVRLNPRGKEEEAKCRL